MWRIDVEQDGEGRHQEGKRRHEQHGRHAAGVDLEALAHARLQHVHRRRGVHERVLLKHLCKLRAAIIQSSNQ